MFIRFFLANLITPRINNTNMENIVDVSKNVSQVLFAPVTLKFFGAKIMKSLNTSSVYFCSLKDIIEYMNSPRTQKWKKININGNVSLLDDETPLNRIIDKAVKKNNETDIITQVCLVKISIFLILM